MIHFLALDSEFQEADLILGCLRMTYARYQHFDYPQPWCSTVFNLMIPIPEAQVNLAAIGQVYDYQVRAVEVPSLESAAFQ